MNKLLYKIQYRTVFIIIQLFNLDITRAFPKHSTRKAKKVFGNKPVKVLEIGTYKGWNAKSILKELNVKELYIIDPYEEYEDYLKAENNKTKKFMENCRKIAERRLFKWNNKLIWIKKKSGDAVNDIKDNSMDFIYIDGNHTYKYVLEDMNNYWPKLKKGGLFTGHDITNHRGVGEALFEFCKEKNITPIITKSCWIIIKE